MECSFVFSLDGDNDFCEDDDVRFEYDGRPFRRDHVRQSAICGHEGDLMLETIRVSTCYLAL